MAEIESLFKNNYPIVLVHGYCGSTLDENWILGGYFHYAYSSHATYLGKSDLCHLRYIDNIYEVDVAAVGSVHDRACELY